MQITLNTAESSEAELTALIALLASLGGRLPVGNIVNIEHRGPSIRLPEPEVNISTGDPAMSADEETADNHPNDESPVDSAGIPWDERIHSSSKERNKSDDTWRKRRGVSDETFGTVMEELRAALADGSYMSNDDEAPPPPPADEPEGNDEQVPAPPAPTEDKPSAPAPAASAPAAGEPDATGGQFADFPAFVGAVSKHGKTYAELNEMAGMLGVPMFKDMKDHPDKWDMFFSMIG